MSKDRELPKDFKWILEEEYAPDRPVFEESSGVPRSLGHVLMSKFSENAIVPVGIIATTVCLGMGLANMTKGNVRRQQIFMRGRVLFQATTFLAMGAGLILTALRGSDNKKKRQQALEQQQQSKDV